MKTRGRGNGGARGYAAAALAAGLLALGAVGCKSKDTAAPIVGPDGGDPAAANMAQPYDGGTAGGYSTASAAQGSATPAGKTRVLSSSQSYPGQVSGEDYSDPFGGEPGQQPAPIIRQAPQGSDTYGAQGAYDQGYTDAEEAGAEAIADTNQAPPPLPEYDQPPAPDPNYLWTPGYWDYASAGYYWVPGAWVAPPFYGALWTPAWWGYTGGHYWFHRGYWGPHVGFYGGINYGFGYVGTGYYGGYWRGHDFFYNRAVTNVNVGNVHNVYDRAVVFDNHTYGPRPENRVDFDGGRGGLNARPNASEMAAMHEAHYAPVAAQREVRVAAESNRGQFTSANGGHPAMAFTAHPAGSAANIAAVPHGQPFNRGGQTPFAGHPGQAFAANDHDVNGGNLNGAGARAGVAPGRTNMEPGARPGVQPGMQPGAPSGMEANHGGYSAQGRPSIEAGRTGAGVSERHGAEAGRNTPAAPIQSRPGNSNFSPGAHGGAMPERQAAPVERLPLPAARPAAPVERQISPVQRAPEPAFHPAAPAVRPEAAPRAAAPAPRPAAPAPAPRPAAPAPAPHGAAPPHGGGAEHGGHR